MAGILSNVLPAERSCRSTPSRSYLECGLALLALICLVGVLVAKVRLAGSEDTLWMDEVYSLEMASADLPRLADLAVQDLHPPLYYLALHGWLAAHDALAIPRSIRSARALNIVVWVVLVVIAWRTLAGALGSAFGALGALLVGSSAHIVQFTQDARSYGFAEAGIAVCGFLVVRDVLNETPAARSTLVRAITYALSASVAAWSHLLSWPLLALLGAAWLLLRWRFLRARERAWYWPPIVASLVPLFLVGAWIPVALDRASALRDAAPRWMTPASLSNFGRVFWEWLPFGRDGLPWAQLPHELALAIGALSLAPFVLLVLPGQHSEEREQEERQERSLWLALAMAAASLVFVVGLWGASRLGWLALFHGPRYPCLAAAFWATSLLLAAARFSRFGRRPTLAVLALAPWLLGSGVALASTAALPSRSLAAELRDAAASLDGGAALPIFHLQEELAPYFRRTLAALDSRPADGLPCSVIAGDALLLGLNRWRELESAEALRVHSALAFGLVHAMGARPIPVEHPSFEISRVSPGAPVSPVLRDWCEGKRPLALGQGAAQGAAVAAPQGQRYRDGWSYLEFDRQLRPYRWTRSPRALLRFSGEISGGRYLVRLKGASRPSETRERRLCVRTRTGTKLFDAPIAPGAFEVTFELALPPGSQESDVLLLEHEVTPVTVGTPPGDSYQRTIGILVREATLEPLLEP